MIGDDVSFRVAGIPVAQGSKNGYVRGNRAVLVDVNKDRLKPWRAEIAKAADVGVTFDCPVAVKLEFFMPRPKRPKFNRPAVKPDIDKLARAVLDGLTDGGLLADDSRVVRLVADEFYTETPGVSVTVREVADAVRAGRKESS